MQGRLARSSPSDAPASYVARESPVRVISGDLYPLQPILMFSRVGVFADGQSGNAQSDARVEGAHMASTRKLRSGSRPASAGLALLRDETGSIRRRVLLGMVVLLAAVAGTLVYVKLAHAAVTVTPANYTTNADTAANGSAPAWSANLSIVISEQVKTDFPNATSKTVVLDAPSGWAFNTAAGTTAPT